MKIVATYHAPSSVLDSIKCTLADNADSQYLIVAKLNRVDFYSIHPQGLHHENGVDIWGRVRAVRQVPLRFKNLLSVLVLTDHPEPKLIFLSLTVSRPGMTELTVTKHLCLFERNSRPAEYFYGIVINHTGAYAVASVYTARLRIILLDNRGQHKHDFDVSTTELNLLSLAFVGMNTLALLHVDFRQRLRLLAREIILDDGQLSPVASPLLTPLVLPETWFTIEENPPRLVFISANKAIPGDFNGGILIVGGCKIILYDLARGDVLEKSVNKARRMEKKGKANIEEEGTPKEKGKETEYKKRKPRAVVDWPWSEVTAICSLDKSNMRFLIGDKFGRLAMLYVDMSGDLPLTLIALGEASSPTTLTYLANQVFYLGSHFGNSQLLRIRPFSVSESIIPTLPVPPTISTIKPSGLTRAGKGWSNDTRDGLVVVGFGGHLEELESFHNLAPIVDAVLVDIDKSGQKEIVTCSGGRNTGCLKVVRRGADFREAVVVQSVHNIRKIWSLSKENNDREHSHLVVSAFEQTRVFCFDEGRGDVLPELQCSPASFETSARTLALSNIMRRSRHGGSRSSYENSSLVIQVVPHGLILLEYNPETKMFVRKGDIWARYGASIAHQRMPEIVCADINASQIVLGLKNRMLLLLNLDNDDFHVHRGRQFDNEISAVSCTPLEDHKNYAAYFAVAFWRSDYVMIVSSASQALGEICKSPRLPAAPRSLLLHAFSEGNEKSQTHPHLLVGLVDGSVVTFVFRDEGNGQGKALMDMKCISIGTLPVSLHPAMIEGKDAVVACGSRSSVLCWDKEWLVHSPLMLKGVSAAVYLNTKAYPTSMVTASSKSLIIGSVTKFERVHVRSVSLGYDSPRCIVHCPSWKAFSVACTHTTPAQVGQAELIRSSVQLFSENSLEKLAQVTVSSDEEVTSLHHLTVTLAGISRSFVCAGVTTFDAAEQEPSQGRLILLEMSLDNNLAASKVLTICATVPVKGAVYALTSINETIIAAVNSSVVLIRIEGTAKSISLRVVTTWNHNYLISTLVSQGDRLLVGDALTSVSLLKMAGSALEAIAKDYSSLWPTCVQMLDEKRLIGANSDYNLFAFRLEKTETREILEQEGHYFLGDIVNKFLPGAMAPQEVSMDIPIEPKQLFFTSTGHIGIIAEMNEEFSLCMTALQRNMSTYYERKEGISHASFRAPKNQWGRSDSEASSIGFLDGDFLERFLTVMGNSNICHEIMKGQSEPERILISPELIQKVLERLQSMH